MMNLFRAVLVLMWLAVMVVSYQAVAQMGLSAAGDVFFGDLLHPWRGQFLTDFTAHVVLMVVWILYREKRLYVGIPCAVLALLGGVFSLLYVLAATYRAQGDARRLLLGDRSAVAQA